tara:strand:- start:3326 stop:5230 length:1905 start_codon:yes stop_codon:yes gene_type:complete
MDIKDLNFSKFLNLPRQIKLILMILIDSSLCCLSIWFAYYLRIGNFSTPIKWMLIPVLISIIISLSIFWFLGVYKNISRSFNKYNITKLFEAISIYSIFFFLIITIFSLEHVPRTIGLIQPILFLLFLYIIRSFFSYLLNYEEAISTTKNNIALIYGSGNAGVQLLNSLENSDLYVEGFLDDNDQLNGMTLNGKVIYNTKDIEKLISLKKVNQVLLAIPSLSRNDRNKIFQKMLKYPIAVKALPTLSDLAEGLVQLTDIQEPNTEDFLGREQIEPHANLMKKNILNKVILISGAGGSIGSELSRQIVKLNPKKIILFENNEFALYKITADLSETKKKNPKLKSCQIISLLGSISDKKLIEQTINSWKPDTVFHSAAYKHVSLVEQNVIEGVKNNVFGTINILKSSISNKVSNFVLISTDKAVKPKNIMGATKRLAEMYIQAFNKFNNPNVDINLTIVRFGNVLESSGSVIPIFKKQIKYGGPLTLSDLNVTRYFMTIPEASSLVIQSSALTKKDEIFVLDMGKPVKILDLAYKMISLSGLTVKDELHPYGDIEITIKGLYPGEKLHEDLLVGTNPVLTEHPKILKVKDYFIEFKELEKKLEQLKLLIEQKEVEKVINFFNELSDDFDLENKDPK